MELEFSACGPLNTVASSKAGDSTYTVSTAYSCARNTTVVTRDGQPVAQIEWPAFGPNMLTLGLDRAAAPAPVRVGAFLKRDTFWTHSRTFEHEGTLYTWLDVPFRPLRLVAEGEKTPVAVLSSRSLAKPRLSVSTEGVLDVGPDMILVTALVMLNKRRQRRRRHRAVSGSAL